MESRGTPATPAFSQQRQGDQGQCGLLSKTLSQITEQSGTLAESAQTTGFCLRNRIHLLLDVRESPFSRTKVLLPRPYAKTVRLQEEMKGNRVLV